VLAVPINIMDILDQTSAFLKTKTGKPA